MGLGGEKSEESGLQRRKPRRRRKQWLSVELRRCTTSGENKMRYEKFHGNIERVDDHGMIEQVDSR
jgi:hypothetical protein